MRLKNPAKCIYPISEKMANSDVFTISALLVLIMGAVCFYLYTRIKQVEKKVTLVEGILLDLKTATEASFMDFPAASSYMLAKDIGEEEDDTNAVEEEPFIPQEQVSGASELPAATIKPFNMDNITEETEEEEEMEAFVPAVSIVTAIEEISPVTINKVEPVKIVEAEVEAEGEAEAGVEAEVDLELLNVKELIAIARSKGLPVSRTMRKQQLIELINTGNSSALMTSTEEPITMTGSSLTAAPF